MAGVTCPLAPLLLRHLWPLRVRVKIPAMGSLLNQSTTSLSVHMSSVTERTLDSPTGECHEAEEQNDDEDDDTLAVRHTRVA